MNTITGRDMGDECECYMCRAKEHFGAIVARYKTYEISAVPITPQNPYGYEIGYEVIKWRGIEQRDA